MTAVFETRTTWPKNWKVYHRSRPGTFSARMDSASLRWRPWSARRYALTGALHAMRVLSRRHGGQDWEVFAS